MTMTMMMGFLFFFFFFFFCSFVLGIRDGSRGMELSGDGWSV